MIPIPTLPSDSLYKFLFIGGLLLFGLSIWLIADERKHEYDVETEYDMVTYPQAMINIYLDSMYLERYDNYSKGLEKMKSKEDKRWYWEKLDDIEEKLNKLGYPEDYAKSLIELHKAYHSKANWTVGILGLFSIVSFVATVIGWRRWSKQQNVQDDFILQQFALQSLEVEIKTLELQQNLENLQMRRAVEEANERNVLRNH